MKPENIKKFKEKLYSVVEVGRKWKKRDIGVDFVIKEEAESSEKILEFVNS